MGVGETSPLGPLAGQRSSQLSVVIPVKNEAENLRALLPLLQPSGCEIWVVDGGSEDDSVAIAQSLGAQVCREPRGRAQQMNLGAEKSTGKVLLFLHADTRLPNKFEALIEETLSLPGIVAGAFDLRIEGKGLGLRGVELGVRWRSHLFQMPYGDQGIFLRRSTFEAMGGFGDLPIMEDFDLVRRLRRVGQVAIAPAAVTTSARRWRRVGVLRTTLVNQLMIAGYFLGVRGDRLARWYRHR